MRSQKIAKIQEYLTDKCAAILLAYRKYCAASAPASQVSLRSVLYQDIAHFIDSLSSLKPSERCLCTSWRL